jgi:hypothetical protein
MVVNAQTGTTYTLALTDDAKLITLSNALAIVVTVPTNASIALPVGAQITLAQIGAGQASIVGAGGVTIVSTGAVAAVPLFRAQYSCVSLIQYAANTWIVAGDIS